MQNIILKPGKTTEMAKLLFREERNLKRLDGWFFAREAAVKASKSLKGQPKELVAAQELRAIFENLPLSISENAIFAGTQRDAFARSYALINPAFEVETFSGYCDPTAVFNDIEPNEEITAERISTLRNYTKQSDFVK
ncbi:MAG: hypothetical protein WCN92_12995, partial [Eubacteriales bacterium]